MDAKDREDTHNDILTHDDWGKEAAAEGQSIAPPSKLPPSTPLAPPVSVCETT